jgi:hypothetical protein
LEQIAIELSCDKRNFLRQLGYILNLTRNELIQTRIDAI